MKNPVIHCTQPIRGALYFFVVSEGERYYLFGQSFRPSLWNRYRFGVQLDDALDWDKCRHNPAGRKVCEKLFKALPYIEKEYGVVLLRRSGRKSPDRGRLRRRDRGLDERGDFAA